jgi:hypothetical protein
LRTIAAPLCACKVAQITYIAAGLWCDPQSRGSLMDLDRIPRLLKALAASLWVTFVLAPLGAWLMHHHGDGAVWIALPCAIALYTFFYMRQSGDDVPDAEYYRRKASVKSEC